MFSKIYIRKSKGLYTSNLIEIFMENETTIMHMSGTCYVRIPPAFMKHLKINKEDTKAVIIDETGKKGNYLSIFVKDGEQ